jgi:hypothetical protein
MVSILRKQCRFPKELEMEVYAGIVGKEAAIAFLRWQASERDRPLTAGDILDCWQETAERAKAQRDDQQAATMNALIAHLRIESVLTPPQEEHLVEYIDMLPRDLRFALVKSLLTIPTVAQALAQDKYDRVILEAIRAISVEVS